MRCEKRSMYFIKCNATKYMIEIKMLYHKSHFCIISFLWKDLHEKRKRKKLSKHFLK